MRGDPGTVRGRALLEVAMAKVDRLERDHPCTGGRCRPLVFVGREMHELAVSAA